MRARTESGLTRNQVVQQLTRSPHGKLSEYVPVGHRAAGEDPEFFAHLIAWNEKNGQVRDAKVALPPISLSTELPEGLIENSLAHMAALDPRSLEKSLRFSKSVGVKTHGRQVRRMVESYLRTREKNWAWWERSALQHRDSMKALYALSHTKPNAMAQQILFRRDYPKGTLFFEVAHLKEMSPVAIAGTILKRKIPFLIAQGALGEKMKDPDVALAMIKQMSPTEIQTNARMLEKLGVSKQPALRAAMEEALAKVAESRKTVLKTTKASKAVTDKRLKARLEATQEKQIERIGIDGNWLVLGDCSRSMQYAIEASRLIAGTLSKLVKGEVHLVFFNTTPTYYPVTGESYESIKEKTRYVRANGGTSIGCGLASMMMRDIKVDGIAIVSDAAENTPPLFAQTYTKYSAQFGKEVPVYLYRLTDAYAGHPSCVDLALSMRAAGHDLQEFDLRSGVDEYSLPNLAQTMRSNRYSLADEIMSVPLLTLEQALKKRVA